MRQVLRTADFELVLDAPLPNQYKKLIGQQLPLILLEIAQAFLERRDLV